MAQPSMHFEVTDTTTSRLWDFGWFDRSRIRVACDDGRLLASDDVIRGFISSGLFRRQLCTQPDPWGAPGANHGPFLADRLSRASYLRCEHEELIRRVDAVLKSTDFDSPPSDDQLMVVTSWVRELAALGTEVFILEKHHAQDALIDWHWIWVAFTEIIGVLPNRREIMIGIIGYD